MIFLSRIFNRLTVDKLLRPHGIVVNRLAWRTATSTTTPEAQNKLTNVTFVMPDGSKKTVKGHAGKTIYDTVIDNNLDLDGFGACEGTLCCTTCHVILKEPIGEASDEELDMLDLAFGLTDKSRLGCQVKLPEGTSDIEVEIPASINDVRA